MVNEKAWVLQEGHCVALIRAIEDRQCPTPRVPHYSEQLKSSSLTELGKGCCNKYYKLLGAGEIT